MADVALKPLTVGFHEAGFAATLNQENRQPFWFQLSDKERQQVGSPWGPQNPQALNRYSYVLNNPLRWTDPSGHTIYMDRAEAEQYIADLEAVHEILTAVAVAGGFGSIPSNYASSIEALSAFARKLLARLTAALALGGGIAAIAAIRLGQYIRHVKENMGDSGVIISAECWGVFWDCNVTIINPDTGNGVVTTVPKALNMFDALSSKSYQGIWAPGRACTLSGGDAHPANGKYYNDDNRLCNE
jgi:hypothetical protein